MNFTRASNTALTKRWLVRLLLGIAVLAASLGAWYYILWVWNPLPSDEEMIENFQANRADFVEIVRRYREYPRPPDKDTSFWFKDGDTLELFKRARLDR